MAVQQLLQLDVLPAQAGVRIERSEDFVRFQAFYLDGPESEWSGWFSLPGTEPIYLTWSSFWPEGEEETRGVDCSCPACAPTPERRLTDEELAQALERERARMADPEFRRQDVADRARQDAFLDAHYPGWRDR